MGLRDVVNGVSRGVDPTDVLGATMDAVGLGYATSPPLLLGQLQIDAMKLVLGFGPPETADGLRKSVSNLNEAGDILVYADPHHDRWDGAASTAYAGANSQHRHQTTEIAIADSELHAQIAAQAEAVATARRLLQNKWDYLSAQDAATGWMTRIPGLGEVKLAMDLAVAVEQTAEARFTLAQLTYETLDRASKVDTARARYEGAAAGHFPDEFRGCGSPFGDEHPPGELLPSRIQPPPRWTAPNPEPPPTPPATPYGTAGTSPPVRRT